jgi:putative salt-induced outer membrane protein
MRFHAFVIILTLTSFLSADTVTFKNGDKLTGEILKLEGGKLTFKTAAIGTVQISTSEIASLNGDTDMSVKVKGQDAKVGRLQGQGNATNLAGKDPLNAIAADQFDSIDTLASLQSAIADTGQKFSGGIDVGISNSSGNTSTESFYIRGAATLSEVMAGGFKDPLTIKGDYLYKKDTDVLTARRGKLEGRYDSLFRERTSIFFLERVAFDEFSNLDLRVEEQVGLSQKLIVKPRYSLSGDLGVTRIDSFFESSTSEGDFGIVVGGHFDWRIIGQLYFTEDVEYKPEFGKFSNYLLKAETGLTTKLSAQWKVALLHQLDYDNQPPAGTSGTDKNLILTFGYSF